MNPQEPPRRLPPLPKTKAATEYLLVSDHDSKVLKAGPNYYELVRLANLIRRGGGSVTIFKSTNG